MTEKEHQRIIKHRLAVIRHADEVTGNVAATCRYFGISRQCFYTWLRRFEEEGEEGLRERSRRPLTSPRATQSEVVGKCVFRRIRTLSPEFSDTSPCSRRSRSDRRVCESLTP